MLMLGPLAVLHPLWLASPLAAGVLLALVRSGGATGWHRAIDAHLLAFLAGGHERLRTWPGIAPALVAAMAGLALAAPALDRAGTPGFAPTRGLVFLLDVSASMDLAAGQGTRLAQAKAMVGSLAAAQPDRQMALIVFAGDAYLLTPFVTDGAALGEMLDGVTPGMVPEKGSRPTSALSLASQILQQAQIAEARVLLVSDGGGVDAATQALAAKIAAGGTIAIDTLVVGLHRAGDLPAEPALRLPADTAAMAALATSGRGAASATLEAALVEHSARFGWDASLVTSPDAAQVWHVIRWPMLLTGLCACGWLFRRRAA